MTEDNPHRRAEVIVTFWDPLTWSREFSYEVERSILARSGVTLVVPEDEAERDRVVRSADVVISSGTVSVDRAAISTMARCVAIQCYSVGMNAVDADAAAERGIRVANVNASTADVADHTIALLLCLARALVPMMQAVERGQWDLRQIPEAWEIRRIEGQTLGIIGTGRIGRAVAVRAQALGYRTIGHDIDPPDPAFPGLDMVDLPTLMARSDAIAVCASLAPGSRHLVDRGALSHVKPGAVLVNAARGGLIDEEALADALDDGRIAMAGLDVRDPEPPDPDNDLLGGRPNVIQTPHMAAMSERTRSDIHDLVAENVLALLRDAGRLEHRP